MVFDSRSDLEKRWDRDNKELSAMLKLHGSDDQAYRRQANVFKAGQRAAQAERDARFWPASEDVL